MPMQKPVSASFSAPNGKYGKWWYNNHPAWEPLDKESFWGQSETSDDVYVHIHSDVEGNECKMYFNNPVIGYPSLKIINGNKEQFHRFSDGENYTFNGIILSSVRVNRQDDSNGVKCFSIWLE